MADDPRSSEEFEQINNDRDRGEQGRNEEDAIGRDTDDDFEDVDELEGNEDSDDSLSQGSE